MSSSSYTVSGILVSNDASTEYKCLKFDSSVNTVTAYSTIASPPENLTNAKVGENCAIIMASSGNVYKVGTSSLTQISLTGSVQAHSPDFRFVIVDNQLMRLNENTDSYDSIKTLVTHNEYRLKVNGQGIIASGSTATVNGSLYSVEQETYFLYYSTTGTVTEV